MNITCVVAMDNMHRNGEPWVVVAGRTEKLAEQALRKLLARDRLRDLRWEKKHCKDPDELAQFVEDDREQARNEEACRNLKELVSMMGDRDCGDYTYSICRVRLC